MVQRQERGPWTHGTIVEDGDQNHNDQSYKACIGKTGWVININSKHVMVTCITSEWYVRDQLLKDRKPETLEHIIGQFENQMQQDRHWTYTKARH